MKKITAWYLHQNIYFKLLPFLFFYIIICIKFSLEPFDFDEDRYVGFANNLLHGFYSPPFPNINVWNGPGYPILLMPFAYLKLPYLYFRLFNSVLLYFSLVISYKTFSIFSSNKSAITYTIILGLYYPIYYDSILIMTESFSWFLINLTSFLTLKYFLKKTISWKLLLLTAFTVAYLAMTKVIFGYVITLMVFVSLAMFLSPFYRFAAKKAVGLFLISFLFCLPWLFYTYNLTHKAFYWTNSGSISLYTMSSPYENELGDWDILVNKIYPLNPKRAVFMDSVYKLEPMQREAAFKEAAILNIKKNPKKYFSNWVANVGRLFFSMPFSNKGQSIRLYFTIVPNMFVVVILFFIFLVSIKHYKQIPVALLILVIFFSIYLFGSTLISTYRRMFHITIPFWFILISYFFNNILLINIKENLDSSKALV